MWEYLLRELVKKAQDMALVSGCSGFLVTYLLANPSFPRVSAQIVIMGGNEASWRVDHGSGPYST